MKLFDFFRSDKENKTVDHSVRLYVRDGKPVALQGWFFSHTSVNGLLPALQRTGLEWVWESTRTGPPVTTPDDDSHPEHRDRIQVQPDLESMLQYDLLEHNLHGFRRFVALYGGEPGLIDAQSDDDLRQEVTSFASGQPSALKVLMVQLGDVAADVIYFDLNKREAVSGLLLALGVPNIDDVFRLAYREMNGEDLDTVIKYLSCAEHDH